MAAKFMFLFFAMFLLAQAHATPTRETRDAPAETKQADPLQSLKEGFENLLQKAQENFKPEKMWEDFSSNLKTLGEKIQTNTKEFANTVQQKTGEILNNDEKPAA